MSSLAALASGSPPGGPGHAQSAAGYLGAAVLRGLLAMSVTRSLDLEYKVKDAKSAKPGTLSDDGGGGSGGIGGGSGGGVGVGVGVGVGGGTKSAGATMTRKAHSVTRAKSGCKGYH